MKAQEQAPQAKPCKCGRAPTRRRGADGHYFLRCDCGARSIGMDGIEMPMGAWDSTPRQRPPRPARSTWAPLGVIVAYTCTAMVISTAGLAVWEVWQRLRIRVTPGQASLPIMPSAFHGLPVAPVVVPPRDQPTTTDTLWDDYEPPATREDVTPREPTRRQSSADLPQHRAGGMIMTTLLVGPADFAPIEIDGPVGDCPKELAEVIVSEVEGPRNQAFLAAMAYVETKYNNMAIRKKCGDDGGHSKGPWQVHDQWAEKAAAHAESAGNHDLAADIRAGISEDLAANLRGVRAFIKVQSAWRPGGYRAIASYYNGGASGLKPGTAGWKYGDRLMAKMDQLLPHFENL